MRSSGKPPPTIVAASRPTNASVLNDRLQHRACSRESPFSCLVIDRLSHAPQCAPDKYPILSKRGHLVGRLPIHPRDRESRPLAPAVQLVWRQRVEFLEEPPQALEVAEFERPSRRSGSQGFQA